MTIMTSYAVAAHWEGAISEPELEVWASDLRAKLRGDVTFGLLFTSPSVSEAASTIVEIIRIRAEIPLLAGCSGSGFIANEREFETQSGFALALYHLPGADLNAFHFPSREINGVQNGDFWRTRTETIGSRSNGWLLFADPFHLHPGWLDSWNDAFAPLPIVGGLAAGAPGNPHSMLFLNGDIFADGVVAVSVGGKTGLESVICQGCTPIGETWTITKAAGTTISQIANRPAAKVLIETLEALPESAKQRAKHNLFVGVVIDEYREEFERGDFLIRNLIGIDPDSGALAVGAGARPGQTIQFQLRDAQAAHEDLYAMLEEKKEALSGKEILGGCLFSCLGRGKNLFGVEDHDAAALRKTFGPIELAGFFCNGEIGPVGDRSYIHGYTACLALFVRSR